MFRLPLTAESSNTYYRRFIMCIDCQVVDTKWEWSQREAFCLLLLRCSRFFYYDSTPLSERHDSSTPQDKGTFSSFSHRTSSNSFIKSFVNFLHYNGIHADQWKRRRTRRPTTCSLDFSRADKISIYKTDEVGT